jgi:hypothetical protein
MAQGDLRGNLTASTANVSNPTSLTGSVAVSLYDLVFVAFSQQTNLTATTVTDNLGNTYSAVNAGTDAGTATLRCYYSRVTVAGTLTTIDVAATGSTNDASGVAAVIEGPFKPSPLDANPANTTDGTSPFTCPATGTLAEAEEVVLAAIGVTGNMTVAATSPFTLSGTVNRSNISTGVSRRKVSATTTQTPEFTGTDGVAAQTTASFKLALVLIADTTSYTVTGTAADLERGREVLADPPGSYVITGTAATLNYAPGAFQNTAFQNSAFQTLAASGGAYSVTADAGAYTTTGGDANLEWGREVLALGESYTISGQDASLELGREVLALGDSYTINGQDAGFLRGYEVLADSGTYAFTGGDASLEWGREVLALSESYVITGGDASLERGYEVLADPGSYLTAGQDSSLEFGREIAADSAVYSIGGGDASLELGREVAADSAAYVITGGDSSLEYGREVAADSATYSVTGGDASLERGYEVPADAGAYVISGTDAGLLTQGATALIAESGTYTTTGGSSSLELGRELTPDSGVYVLTGNDSSLEVGREIAADSASYVLTGGAADLLHEVIPAQQPSGGGSSAPAKDDWWRSPPGKKRRKAKTIDTEAPTEAPLSVSDEAARIAADVRQRELAAEAAIAAQAEADRLRRLAIMADDELVLLLAA